MYVIRMEIFMTKQDKKNAYLYCKFRDEQFALYDAYAKKNGILMNTFLVLNVLYYAKEGLTQKEICERTFHSKQTLSLIVKKLLQQSLLRMSIWLPVNISFLSGY